MFACGGPSFSPKEEQMNSGLTRVCSGAILILALLIVGRGIASAQLFTTTDFKGRFIASAHGDDQSSTHPFSTPDDSNIGPSINFVSTGVMISDGAGHVCGESSGLCGGFIGANGVMGSLCNGQTGCPVSNSGPTTFHGTYTVDAVTGRIQIDTCADMLPIMGDARTSQTITTIQTFCVVSQPNCTGTKSSIIGADADSANNHKTQLGYLQNHAALAVGTVERENNSFSSGFIVINRLWQKQPGT